MPNTDDWFERERLHRAAADNDMYEVVRLIGEGFSLDAFDDLQMTPLHHAVQNEHYKLARWLLENGAPVNANDEARIGETPLCLAAQGKYPEIVELLIQHGADPDINGWMGLTARIRAQSRTDAEGKEISSVIERLCPSRPNPNGTQAVPGS
jgi:ankyrin repeat protein